MLKPRHPSVRLPLVGPLLLLSGLTVRLQQAGPGRTALLRPAHPADVQQLLRREHLALPPDRQRHPDRRAGNLDLSSFEARAEAAGRPAQLRRLPAAAAAAEGVAGRGGADPLPGQAAAPARSATWAESRCRPAPTRSSRSSAGSTTGPPGTAWPPPPRPSVGAGGCHQRPLESPGAGGGPQHRPTSASRATSRRCWCAACAFSNCHSSPQADFYPDLRGDRRAARRQLPARGQLHRPGHRPGGGERAAAAAAGAQGGRSGPHRRRLLPHPGGRQLAAAARLGRAVPAEPPARTDPVGRRDASSPRT